MTEGNRRTDNGDTAKVRKEILQERNALIQLLKHDGKYERYVRITVCGCIEYHVVKIFFFV
jgi:hypothetical protein